MERDRHPDPELLERFMRNQAQPSDRLWIVRHLLAGCQKCTAVTRELWSLGDPPRAQHRQPSTASPAMAPTLVPMPCRPVCRVASPQPTTAVRTRTRPSPRT